MKFNYKLATKLNGYRGACSMSDLIPFDREVEKIYPKLNYGEMFAYLFRRFGIPKYNWDSYKTLCSYYLTTPKRGVVLSVRPTDVITIAFGYMLSKGLDKKCQKEMSKPEQKWFSNIYNWCEREKGVILIMPWDYPIKKKEKKINKALIIWLKKNYPKIKSDKELTKSIVKEFTDYNWKLWEKINKEYCKKVEKYPDRKPKKGSIRQEVKSALITTLKDLKKVIYIRDVPINITGKVSDDEASKLGKVDYIEIDVNKYHKPEVKKKKPLAVKIEGGNGIPPMTEVKGILPNEL